MTIDGEILGKNGKPTPKPDDLPQIPKNNEINTSKRATENTLGNLFCDQFSQRKRSRKAAMASTERCENLGPTPYMQHSHSRNDVFSEICATISEGSSRESSLGFRKAFTIVSEWKIKQPPAEVLEK